MIKNRADAKEASRVRQRQEAGLAMVKTGGRAVEWRRGGAFAA